MKPKPNTPTDLELDFREREGFQIGKAAALAESAFRRENREFKKLCTRLYARNWARKRRRERPEHVRGLLNGWRAKNRERINAKERARRAKKRVPIRLVCKGCGKSFVAKRRTVPRGETKWCSAKCRRHASSVAAAKRRNRGIRNMQIGPTVFEVLRATPGLTLAEIHERAPSVKRGSLATKLSVWVKAGTVERVDGRYRLPASASEAA